jgi:hypothetical protein
MLVARYYRRDPAVKVGPANCIHKHANIYKYFFQFKGQMSVVTRLTCTRARELCETSIYVADTAAENRKTKHPSTNNAYVSQRSDTRARG